MDLVEADSITKSPSLAKEHAEIYPNDGHLTASDGANASSEYDMSSSSILPRIHSFTSMLDLETDDLSFSHHDGSIPSKPAIYCTHLCRVFNIPSSANVVDLTSYIDRGPLIATGGFGQVYKGSWKNVEGLDPDDRQKLPQVAVKVINPLTLDDDKQSKVCIAFDNGHYEIR
jgi:hypothetical protein